MKPPTNPILGVDIGGTFTDFVLVENGQVTIHKQLTTPEDPSTALLEGVATLRLSPEADVVHGSTIATNALLERRGAKTALITTEGFKDVIEIGRQNRPDLYALVPQRPAPLVPAPLRFEVEERIGPAGEVSAPLNPASLAGVLQQIEALGVESAAVCLLFSFSNPAHEEAIREAIKAQFGERVYVSLSSEVLPEYREYERASTTIVNAYVAPLVDRYLKRVETGLEGRRLRIMQSNGGVITAKAARKEAARTALSGPAGGAVGAFHVAQIAGHDRIISFDMGGTSTDVAIFPGEMIFTRESEIGGLPLRLPIVDVHTVGAGGGSIARVDEGGALQVGPESAGANPGPACYGKGDRPTTSDANLVLGRLNPAYFLGGKMLLHEDRARAVLSQLAADMGVKSPEAAAMGVIQVSHATMERAIRAISVERGYDPRHFTLVPFGGAGPLHACALAESLCIPRVLVPCIPGVLSALGMTIADLVKDYARSVLADDNVINSDELATIFKQMDVHARQDLMAEGIAAEKISTERALDMRYAGQSHEITIGQPADDQWIEAFHAAHKQHYGHRHDNAQVEVVNARLRAVGYTPKPAFETLAGGETSAESAKIGSGPAWFSLEGAVETRFYARDWLLAGNTIAGPAIVFQLDTTTVIPPGWVAIVDQWGNLLLTQ